MPPPDLPPPWTDLVSGTHPSAGRAPHAVQTQRSQQSEGGAQPTVAEAVPRLSAATTSRGVKATSAALGLVMAAAAASGMGIWIGKAPSEASASTVAAAPAAQTQSHDTPSRSEVEMIANKAADAAAARVSSDWERRRLDQRELLEQKIGRLNDSIGRVDNKIDDLHDLLRTTRARRGR